MKKYDRLLSVPVNPVEDLSPGQLTLTPADSGEWKYVLFCPSYFPKELSRATENEPDTFLVREGGLCLGKTRNGKSLIGGGDTVSRIVTAIGSEDGINRTVTLLCEDSRLRQAKPKGGTLKPRPDTQFRYLLGLENPENHDKLKPGLRWRGLVGRVKPFVGFSTDYEVAGFAEIAGRRTVDIAFSGLISHRIPQPASDRKARSTNEVLVENRHHGHAWFDLENGFLIRQETEMECRMSDITGYRATDGSNSLEVTTKSTLQLFTA